MTTDSTLANTDNVPDDTTEMIDYIQTRYHAVHRSELPEIAALAEKVEQVHGDHPDAPHGLANVLHQMTGELEVHMKKEELILFPAMRSGRQNGIETPIAVMRADHDDHAENVARIREITRDLTLPEDACRSWTALYQGVAKFLADLDAHIRLENEVLFSRFEVDTTEARSE